jgi:hypothetical protein
MSDYAIVEADEAKDAYADSDVPGEFRSLTEALGAEQLAVTLMRIPPTPISSRGRGIDTARSRRSTSSPAAR